MVQNMVKQAVSNPAILSELAINVRKKLNWLKDGREKRLLWSESRALHTFFLTGAYGCCRLKGKYQVNLLSFQNPKMFVCQGKQRNNCQVCYKLTPQCNKTVD